MRLILVRRDGWGVNSRACTSQKKRTKEKKKKQERESLPMTSNVLTPIPSIMDHDRVSHMHFGYKSPTIVPSIRRRTRRMKRKREKQTTPMVVNYFRAREMHSRACPDFSYQSSFLVSTLFNAGWMTDLILIIVYNEQHFFMSPPPSSLVCWSNWIFIIVYVSSMTMLLSAFVGW